MADERTVAVLGTGIMGLAMAGNLCDHGFAVRAWNRSGEKARRLAEHGAVVAETPADAVRGAAFIITMLADAAAVAAVAADALAWARDDAVWVQMSTVGPEATGRFAVLAGERGVAFVDAPVLGTKEPAEQGALTVLAAGPEPALQRCEPLFSAVGSRTLRVGEVGDASRLKLVVNTWIVALVGALAESVALARALDVAPTRFLEAIDGGPVGPPYAAIKGRAMIRGQYPASFPLRLALKDARLALDAAEKRGLRPALLQAVSEALARAVDQGHADEDMAAVYRVIDTRLDD